MAETYLKGLDDVMKNLNKEVQAIEGKTMKGLIKAAIIVRRDMDKTSPKIPVDTGNLRSSWFVTPVSSPTKPILIAGFSANYALWVHENMEAKRVRPGSGAKFYEASLNRNHGAMIQAIKDEIKIV
jgi:hypothetical protein